MMWVGQEKERGGDVGEEGEGGWRGKRSGGRVPDIQSSHNLRVRVTLKLYNNTYIRT